MYWFLIESRVVYLTLHLHRINISLLVYFVNKRNKLTRNLLAVDCIS